MNSENRKIIVAAAVVVILISGMYLGLKAYSGVDPPTTVINSGSMQHSTDSSHLGIIDTGDMMVVRDPDSVSIRSYVDGAKSGYRSFGEYGDVIVYKKPNQNIIHRAMLHLELVSDSDPTQRWSIPSLKDYNDWDITIGSNYDPANSKKSQCWDEATGILKIDHEERDYYFWLLDVGYAGANVSIKLYSLGSGEDGGYGGYLTKGDNAESNNRFDQSCGIYDKLVDDSIIKSVAVFEIPWIGSIKLMLNGKGSVVPSNSKIFLITGFILFIALIFAVNHILDRIDRRKAMEEEMRAPSRKIKRR